MSLRSIFLISENTSKRRLRFQILRNWQTGADLEIVRIQVNWNARFARQLKKENTYATRGSSYLETKKQKFKEKSKINIMNP